LKQIKVDLCHKVLHLGEDQNVIVLGQKCKF